MAGSVIYKICERIERSYNRELGKFKAAQGLNAPAAQVSGKRNAKQVLEESAPAQVV